MLPFAPAEAVIVWGAPTTSVPFPVAELLPEVPFTWKDVVPVGLVPGVAVVGGVPGDGAPWPKCSEDGANEALAPAGNEPMNVSATSICPVEPVPRNTVTGYVALEPCMTGLGDCASTTT